MTTALKVTEKQFQTQVTQLAQIHGWRSYHPFLSIHSARGWPDLALCRPPRLILAELKSETGKVSDSQWEWLEMLRDCPGVEVHVWRPADLDEINRLLAPSHRPPDPMGEFLTWLKPRITGDHPAGYRLMPSLVEEIEKRWPNA